MGVAGRNAYRTLGGKCLNGLMQAHGGRACFSETAVVAVWYAESREGVMALGADTVDKAHDKAYDKGQAA